MFVLPIGLPSRLARRAPHREGPGRDPEHVHRHRGVQIDRAGPRHRDRASGGGGVARGVRHRIGKDVGSRGIDVHGPRDRDVGR